jgi:hypothetical protein
MLQGTTKGPCGMDWWRAFNNAAGPRRYLIGSTVTLLVGLFDRFIPMGLREVLGVPSWAVGVLTALGFIVFWLLQRLVELERRMRGARLKLAQLRAAGVALRNEARTPLDLEAFADWKLRIAAWNMEVVAEIRKVSEGDAEWFSILDIVETPRIPIHVSLQGDDLDYRMHDLRLKRLGDMIYNLWRP